MLLWRFCLHRDGRLYEAGLSTTLEVKERQIIMADNQPKKCAHPACRCTVAEGKKYCSKRCEDSGAQVEISCDCGHPGCSLAE
jgi:metallothionein